MRAARARGKCMYCGTRAEIRPYVGEWNRRWEYLTYAPLYLCEGCARRADELFREAWEAGKHPMEDVYRASLMSVPEIPEGVEPAVVPCYTRFLVTEAVSGLGGGPSLRVPCITHFGKFLYFWIEGGRFRRKEDGGWVPRDRETADAVFVLSRMYWLPKPVGVSQLMTFGSRKFFIEVTGDMLFERRVPPRVAAAFARVRWLTHACSALGLPESMRAVTRARARAARIARRRGLEWYARVLEEEIPVIEEMMRAEAALST